MPTLDSGDLFFFLPPGETHLFHIFYHLSFSHLFPIPYNHTNSNLKLSLSVTGSLSVGVFMFPGVSLRAWNLSLVTSCLYLLYCLPACKPVCFPAHPSCLKALFPPLKQLKSTSLSARLRFGPPCLCCCRKVFDLFQRVPPSTHLVNSGNEVILSLMSYIC